MVFLRNSRQCFLWAVVLGNCLFCGCQCLGQRSYWQEPAYPPPSTGQGLTGWLARLTEADGASPQDLRAMVRRYPQSDRSELALVIAQHSYNFALLAEQSVDDACVDGYFQAAAFSGEALRLCTEGDLDVIYWDQACDLYWAALCKLVECGQQYRRLDGRRGVLVHGPHGPLSVPAAYYGFAWQAEDFERLQVVGDYGHEFLPQHHRRAGLGVPLVACRTRRERIGRDQFLPPWSTFAASAILRVDVRRYCGGSSVEDGSAGDCGPLAELAFYDPRRNQTIPWGASHIPLAADLTAPLAFQLHATRASVWEGFFRPEAGDARPELTALEPRLPGKIPVVFLHGLLSNPRSWATLVNDLQAHPVLADRYQIFVFRYPTGQSFLRAAAEFREELHSLVAHLDPAAADESLKHMVLVGHSMGGLVSKLQVTSSRDVLWNSIANRPIEEVRTNETTRNELRRVLYFEPVPYVQRVIFVATPHRGSQFANSAIARLGARLVRPSAPLSQELLQVIQDNPGLFHPKVQRRLPTSLDMLEPQHPLLQAIDRLPFSPCVHVHSVVGTGHSLPLCEDGDGVVPVSSARHTRSESQLEFPAKHQGIQREPDAIAEVLRILEIHLAETQDSSAIGTPASEPQRPSSAVEPATDSGAKDKTATRQRRSRHPAVKP